MPADGSHWSCDRCTWLLPSPLLEHALPKSTISEHVKNITRFYLPHYLFLSANKLFLMLMFLPAFIINYQRNSWKKPALPNNTLWKRHFFFKIVKKHTRSVFPLWSICCDGSSEIRWFPYAKKMSSSEGLAAEGLYCHG